MTETAFDSLGAFLAMGGHGFYVWLSYALALAVVVYNIVAPLARRRRFLAAQRGRMRRDEGARDGSGASSVDAPGAANSGTGSARTGEAMPPESQGS